MSSIDHLQEWGRYLITFSVLVKECLYIRHLGSGGKLSGKPGHKLSCFIMMFKLLEKKVAF